MPRLPERPRPRPLTLPRADNGQRTENALSVRPLNMPVPSATGQQTAELPRTPSQAAKSIRLPLGRVEPAKNTPLTIPPRATVSKEGTTPLPAPSLPSSSVQRPLGDAQAPRQGVGSLKLPERAVASAGGLSVPGASQASKTAPLRVPEASGPSEAGGRDVAALLQEILRTLKEPSPFDTVAPTPQPIQLARPMWGDSWQ